MTIRLNTMRWVDRWIGISLCALATPIVILSDKLRLANPGKASPPRRVLFIELSEMGSAVIADPALREAQSRGAEIFFLIFRKNRPSLTLAKTVPDGHILTIDSDSFWTIARDALGFLYQTRRMGIDTVIDMELFSRFSALLTGLCGACRRIGFYRYTSEGLWRGRMLTHGVSYNHHQHMAKNFLALVHAAFSEHRETPFSKIHIDDDAIKMKRVPVPEADLITMRNRITQLAASAGINFAFGRDRLVLLNVNASDLLPQRRWAPERFAALAQQIKGRWPDCLVLLTGSSDEYPYVEDVRQLTGHQRVLNFAGQVGFSELPALYCVAHVMVTNDSGPSHFSALTPLKTVVLFGPETPMLYGSLGDSFSVHAGLACSPCVSAVNHRNTPCRNNICMQAIKVEDVMRKVEQHMLAIET